MTYSTSKAYAGIDTRRFYAGIGSRDTPAEVLSDMKRLATLCQQKGYILRSGAASGADTAFESGAGNLKEIFLPYDGFEKRSPNNTTVKLVQSDWAIELARDVHPLKSKLKGRNLEFHSRNMMQVLGENGDLPVDFVACWTPGGLTQGGTASAMRLARRLNIPIYNLAKPHDLRSLIIRLHE